MDFNLQELERRLVEGDWTVYPRLVRMRALQELRVDVPRVERQAKKLRASPEHWLRASRTRVTFDLRLAQPLVSARTLELQGELKALRELVREFIRTQDSFGKS